MYAEDTATAKIRMLEEDLKAVHSPEVRAFIQEKIESISVRTESASSSTKHGPSMGAMIQLYGVVLVMLVSGAFLLTDPLIPGGYGQSWMDPSQPTTYHPFLPFAFWKVLTCLLSFIAVPLLVLILMMFFERRRDKARSKAHG